ncbi:riboflavin deaminase [Nostoc linckia z18]|uniref:Riboflavin deaminase n=2 Tax=Nostoc linckia TaxID=92942 RepID=A0A9Q5Z818_NOSLI|nr:MULTISPECIES: dihydrofolate reductase family protein [Nostoc]PHK27177.1 riboflavin deaminase [Nostoc linckia z15]PHK43595.1 riboflavin deaminase [Nostoc linckia z16]MBC1241569.1 dihydrofolate reductase family protein [Nostoc sp. 2RC]PHJ56284.1 riboflavin deaminase [Nostoc linckia z1]PHJ58440.1 riboflavin deaminase [Nostoc linckia z3]
MSTIQTTVILAITADGKISPVDSKAPRNSYPVDQEHLEYQVSLADLVLMGAGTARNEGIAFTIENPELLAVRQFRGQPPQPITCVVTSSLNLSPDMDFFRQDLERWIFTTGDAIKGSSDATTLDKLAKLIELGDTDLDWDRAYDLMAQQGIRKIFALGGGSLIASLVHAGRVDDWWLTILPVIYGGASAPTLVEGEGFLPSDAPKLELIETRQVGSELFLHYRTLK